MWLPRRGSPVEADKFLAGKSLDEKTADEAGKQAVMSATPLSQNAYKVQLARVAVKRALLAAAKRVAYGAGTSRSDARRHGPLPKPALERPVYRSRVGPHGPHGNDRAFWCQHTYNCLGPDSKLADEYECNPARPCYEAL